MNAKAGKKGAAEKAADKTDAVSHCEWPRFALGDVCDVQLGKMLSPAAKRGIRPRPYLRNANVQWDHIQTSDVSEMDFTEAEEKKFALQKGDLLVCEGGEPGRAAIWDGRIERCCYQKALHRLRAKSGLADSRFVLFRLWHASFSGEFSDSMSQSTIAHLPEIRLRKLEFRLPPLAEQQRIAARLREQLAAVETARRAVESQLATAQALPAAHLRAVFESTAESKWPRRRLSEIVALLPARSIATAGDVEVRAITSAALTELGFNPAGIKRARMWSHDASESVVADGEILIARSNTAELVGRVSIFPAQGTDVVASDLLIRIKPNPACSAKYLARFLSYLYLTGYWRERASGASSSMKKITRGLLDALEIPLPPLATQRTIAARLDAELSATATLRTALEARLKSLEALPAVLLREAFSEPA